MMILLILLEVCNIIRTCIRFLFVVIIKSCIKSLLFGDYEEIYSHQHIGYCKKGLHDFTALWFIVNLIFLIDHRCCALLWTATMITRVHFMIQCIRITWRGLSTSLLSRVYVMHMKSKVVCNLWPANYKLFKFLPKFW